MKLFAALGMIGVAAGPLFAQQLGEVPSELSSSIQSYRAAAREKYKRSPFTESLYRMGFRKEAGSSWGSPVGKAQGLHYQIVVSMEDPEDSGLLNLVVFSEDEIYHEKIWISAGKVPGSCGGYELGTLVTGCITYSDASVLLNYLGAFTEDSAFSLQRYMAANAEAAAWVADKDQAYIRSRQAYPELVNWLLERGFEQTNGGVDFVMLLNGYQLKINVAKNGGHPIRGQLRSLLADRHIQFFDFKAATSLLDRLPALEEYVDQARAMTDEREPPSLHWTR